MLCDKQSNHSQGVKLSIKIVFFSWFMRLTAHVNKCFNSENHEEIMMMMMIRKNIQSRMQNMRAKCIRSE